MCLNKINKKVYNYAALYEADALKKACLEYIIKNFAAISTKKPDFLLQFTPPEQESKNKS